MSGGRLVVLDRLGREVKRFPLLSGLATLGSDPQCDIRVMLPSVSGHHATVVVHTNQTLVRNVGDGKTLVNGRCVSVAALRHGDRITVGERSLRWDYDDPNTARPLAPEPALYAGNRSGRRARRRGSQPTPVAKDAAVQLAMELSHRASMPANSGGKQVAIVQPQRRDTAEQNDSSGRPSPQGKRGRVSKKDEEISNGGYSTKAEQWIQSRKSTPRRLQETRPSPRAPRQTGTPLRLAVLRAQASKTPKPTKIRATTMDDTKRAAIMLMTGHTKTPSPHRPTYVIKKPSPIRRTPRSGTTPKRNSGTPGGRKRSSGNRVTSIVELSDRVSTSSSRPTPMKSALKDPTAKKSNRKTESIKFDLSNLENYSEDNDEHHSISDTTKGTHHNTLSDDDLTLHYSDTSSVQSPSPRKSIHSRSSKMLEKTLGTSLEESPILQRSTRSTLTTTTPESPRRKSNRGSFIVQKALESSANASKSSRRTTKTLTDHSRNSTVGSAFKTRTLSPRSPSKNLETYSIVDLVSMDSNESGRSTSVYNSAGSDSSAFETPRNSSGRKTKSTIDPNTLIGSSTPYAAKTTRKSKSPGSLNTTRNDSRKSTRSSGSSRRSKSLSTPVTRTEITVNSTRVSRASKSMGNASVLSDGFRRSKSLTTPNNMQRHISVNSTRISRGSKSRSRLNDSDLLLISSSGNSQLEDASPRSSRRVSRTTQSIQPSPAQKRKSSRQSGGDGDITPSDKTANEGMTTPENRNSPEEIGTPVLSIQSLLDSSQNSLTSQSSRKSKGKSIGVSRSSRRTGSNIKKSLSRLTRDMAKASQSSGEKMVTPKSAVKLVQEAVKNKHSTAKKPQSKRSIIDNLDESDIVKQLFNSPVKRKLSQSMTEFSRKQLFDDDEVLPKRPTRNTIALGQTPDCSIMEQTQTYSPEVFVSPISTPSNSPNLNGVKLLFSKKTPENDLRNVRGVKALMKTPRTRRSIKNDLTDVGGVKRVFAKSPKNRLSDVRIKEVFAASPKNDLRRVSGVKSLFQTQKKRKSPRNDLTDVRGVKNLFQKNSPKNDLRRVSGVKRALQKGSPRNDLSDVRGVKRMFRQEKKKSSYDDVSGVEELFNESGHNVSKTDILFDQLLGKPPIKAVYSKSFVKKPPQKAKRVNRSLRRSIDIITHNVEDWIEQELAKRLQQDGGEESRERRRLAADSAGGARPPAGPGPRARGPSLPIKKRCLPRVSPAEGGLLPLKKRAVVHSTPVKGRGDINASELGRVSPIALDASVRSEQSTLPITDTSTSKSRRGTKVAAEVSSTPNKPQTPPKIPTPKKSKTPARNTSAKKSVTPGKKSSPRKSVTAAKKVIPKKSVTPKLSPRKVTPGKQISPKKVVTPGKKISPKEVVTPGKNISPKKVVTPGKNVVTSAKKISPKKVVTPGKHISPKKSVTPGAKISPKKSIRGKRASTMKSINQTKRNSPKKSIKQVKNASPIKYSVDEVSPEPSISSPVQQSKAPTPKARVTRGKQKNTANPKPAPPIRRGKARNETTDIPQEVSKASPRKSRNTRNQEAKAATPKRNTRAKVQKATVVVTKPSPQLKPRGRSRTKPETEVKEVASKTRTKKEDPIVEVEVPKRSRKTAATEKVTEEVNTKSKRRKVESPKESQESKRTRRNVAEEPKNKKKASVEINLEVKSPEKKRGRKTQVEDKQEPKRNRKTRAVESETAKKTEVNAKTEQPKASKARGRKLEVQDSTQSEPTTRSRRQNVKNNETVIPEVKSRKRKSTAEDIVPKKMAKVAEAKPKRGQKVETTKSETKSTRSKAPVGAKEKEIVEEPKTSRSRKAAAKEAVPKTNTRKARAQAVATPVKKVAGKKSPVAKKSPVKARATRATAELAVAATKATGRSRRR